MRLVNLLEVVKVTDVLLIVRDIATLLPKADVRKMVLAVSLATVVRLVVEEVQMELILVGLDVFELENVVAVLVLVGDVVIVGVADMLVVVQVDMELMLVGLVAVVTLADDVVVLVLVVVVGVVEVFEMKKWKSS